MDITTIGKQIAILRKERGIKQEELANHVGVSAQAVSKWENGGVPDTDLLPRIADFFEISIDSLFGRSITDHSNLSSLLMKKIDSTPESERFKLMLNYCWDMERAFFTIEPGDGGIEEYEKAVGKTDQRYSSITSDHGFTLMGLANRKQYFLLVPEMENKDLAYIGEFDYPTLFRDLSDKQVFDACIMLHKREAAKAFTPALLVKNLGVETERAKEIIATLKKYGMIRTTQIEMDDEVQEVYNFCPSPSFVAMLIFTQDLIWKPGNFTWYSSSRNKPYL